MAGLGMSDIVAAFRGRRVLITGDTGFKGAWLSFLLTEAGAEVCGFALPAAERASFPLLGLAERTHHFDGDIRDADAVKQAFSQWQPEFLFHLAAQPLVRLSYAEPKMTFDTNVAGSVNVLEAVRETASLRSVVYVTSDKCYKNREWVFGYRETDELGGHDPYSASKAVAELVFSSYTDSFFVRMPHLGVASARAGNVIGGGDWSADRIVPDSITALQQNQPIRLRNPRATRPWQHVLEPLCGYILLAIRLGENPQRYSGAWNFGPRADSVRPVQDLSEQIVREWGSGEVVVTTEANAPHEAGLLQLNCDKSYHLLNWKPRWEFERTVRETVAWYREVNDAASAVAVTRRQIHEYLESN